MIVGPENDGRPAKNWRRSERILVAANLTEEGGELVTWALTHGSRSGDSVTVIHVVDPCPPVASRAQVARWERQKRDMLNILGELVTYCRTNYEVPNLSVTVQVVESSNIGKGIVQEARFLEATRVILGKRRSRRLELSPKRMTNLGKFCVQNLEPYCDIIVARKGKVIIRRPGTAKFRRSLETLLRSNTKNEWNLKEDEIRKNEQLLGGFDEGLLGEKDLSNPPFISLIKWPSSGKSTSSRSSATQAKNLSRESSFSSRGSNGGSERSPNSVVRIPHLGKSSFSGELREKIDGEVFPPLGSALRESRSSLIGSPFSSIKVDWLGDANPAPRSRCRSSSTSVESVPELQEVQDRQDQEELGPSSLSPPEINDTTENSCELSPGGFLADLFPALTEESKDGGEIGLVADSSPELEYWKRDVEREECAEVPSDFSQLELELREEDGGDEGALVSFAGFAPPQFARICSAVRYSLSEDGLQSLSKDVNLELPEVRKFSYEELRQATTDFAARNIVGTGGASTVYKAQLNDGCWVAVKRLVDSMKGEKEFMMEMMMLICTLNHPNLVTMLGFCAEGQHRLIAYKLLTRGSLEKNLHSVRSSRKLNWEQRQKVAFGASRGLAYLHSFSPQPIIHRDIKTSNILLGDDFEAQISDFGLARWLEDGDAADEQVSCAGTFGYLAPECLMYGGFSERTDVFAFGVVLLELISGRRPMDNNQPDSQTSLVLWARTLQEQGKTHCLVDRSLSDINPQQFKRMMYTAFLCVQVSPDDRPTMDRVVKLLDPECNYSPAILQPNISATPFMSMPELIAPSQQSPMAQLSSDEQSPMAPLSSE